MNIDNELAMVFPGQGSQSIGMMNDLFSIEGDIKQGFASASDVLGYDLWEIISNGPESKLNSTEITQPALLTAAYTTWQLWQKRSVKIPSVLAGHSLGEYTALVCANVIKFEDAVRLVAERGRLMQQAVSENTGAMAAILGLEDELVNNVCKQAAADQIVAVANYNSPGQVVITGHKQAVARAINIAKENGAKRTVVLPVSVPSHCILMRDAAEKFAEILNSIEFKDANIPVIQNIDAQSRTKAVEIRPALLKQLYKPVQWVKTIKAMNKNNITRVIECGPGKVLSGLIRRIERSLDVHFIQDETSLEKTVGLT